MPRVSVILTSYNHEEYIRDSIDSVLSQTFTDFELIIVDDASSDGSSEIISGYSDPRIKVVFNKENIGTVPVLNKTISEIAVGEYIAIHHSDDYWHEKKLEKQVAYLDMHHHVGAVFTSVVVVDAKGGGFDGENHFYNSVFDQGNRTRYEWLNYFFFNGNCLCHPSILIRSECYKKIGLYDNRLCQLPDFDMWTRIVLKYDIFILEEKLTYFRVTGEEASESGDRKETRVRSRLEINEVVKNFKKVKSYDELVRVFPEAQQYYREEGEHFEYVFAMIALGENTADWVKMLGMDILFDVLSDKKQAAELQSLYKFDYQSFKELTGKYDLFHVERMRDMSDELSRLSDGFVKIQASHDDIVNQYETVIAELDSVYDSTGWKLISLYRKVANKFRR